MAFEETTTISEPNIENCRPFTLLFFKLEEFNKNLESNIQSNVVYMHIRMQLISEIKPFNLLLNNINNTHIEFQIQIDVYSICTCVVRGSVWPDSSARTQKALVSQWDNGRQTFVMLDKKRFMYFVTLNMLGH